jgi:hypothetical protein
MPLPVNCSGEGIFLAGHWQQAAKLAEKPCLIFRDRNGVFVPPYEREKRQRSRWPAWKRPAILCRKKRRTT